MKYYIHIHCMGRKKPIIWEFTEDKIEKAFKSIVDKCANNDGFIAFSALDAEEPSAIAIRKSSVHSISVCAEDEDRYDPFGDIEL